MEVTLRTLRLPLPLPSMNDIIKASKSHWSSYAGLKKKWGHTVALYAKSQKFARIERPSHFEFEWMEATVRRDRVRDPDNISSGGRKIILDALQDAGLLENDGPDWVLSFADTFSYGKDVGVRLTVR